MVKPCPWSGGKAGTQSSRSPGSVCVCVHLLAPRQTARFAPSQYLSQARYEEKGARGETEEVELLVKISASSAKAR